MAKGSSYERKICKLLSVWWTEGERDDVFWRTAGSGARATSRRKQGKHTFGQTGDVQATDPIGQPLIDLFSIELKKGYSKDTFMDVFDKKPHMAQQGFEKWFAQAREDYKDAGAKSYMIITERNQRASLVFIKDKAYRKLIEYGVDFGYPVMRTTTFITINKARDKKTEKIFGTTLDNFIASVDPAIIEILAEEW